jgi:hypothetical protein
VTRPVSFLLLGPALAGLLGERVDGRLGLQLDERGDPALGGRQPVGHLQLQLARIQPARVRDGRRQWIFRGQRGTGGGPGDEYRGQHRYG